MVALVVGPVGLPRKRWLANALFLLVTISPWIVFVWLVWPRR